MRTRIELHDAQLAMWNNRAKRNVWRCGRRFGKSTLALALIVEQCGKYGNVIYTAPTFADLEERFVEFESTLKPLLIPSKDFELNFREGGRCLMFGLHRHDAIRSNKFHRNINDEFAHSPYAREAWEQSIRPTLTDYKGDAYFISTPLAQGFFRELSGRCGNGDWLEHHYTTYDNPLLDVAEIEEAKNELPSTVFRQEYLAEFVDVVGSRIKREWIKYTDDVSGDVVIGVDLAIGLKDENDYTAIVATAKQGDNIVVVEAIRGKWTFQEQKEMIVQIANKWNASVRVEQVAYQAAMVQELVRTTNLRVQGVKVHKDKLNRFTVAEGKYEHGLMYHVKGLNEFENELLTFPNSEHDDMCDALVHSINGHTSNFNITLIKW